MPLYEYHCSKCDKTFELIRRFSDPPVTIHEECGGTVEQLLAAPAFQLKGTGWYVTDYKKSGKPDSKKDGDSKSSGDSKSDSNGESKSDSKSESKSESKSSDSGGSSTESKNNSTDSKPAASKPAPSKSDS